jgi:2-amino-4-hydroxy-6-hydroxymethyldihydropteridine diphosphokinase
MSVVFLSLGSNRGNRFQNLILATLKINKLRSTKIEKISSIYETEPYGVQNQQKFLNLVMKISTLLNPTELHKNLVLIETELGRKTKGDLQPREIDIDILFYDYEIIQQTDLRIPHHDLHNRKFVLIPLAEIEPDFIHPVFKKSIKELLSQINDNLSVIKLT